MLPLKKAREAECYTYEDYLTWDQTERYELIDGEPFMMGAPSLEHQEILGELFGQLRDYLKEKTCRVYLSPFSVRLFERDGDHPRRVNTVVEPDLSVICDPKKLDKMGCKGAPDLIIEILSPSTQSHDRVKKFNLYRLAGVREYWLVDPDSRSVQVFVLEEGAYAAKSFSTAGEKVQVSVLEDCEIDLAAVFPPVSE